MNNTGFLSWTRFWQRQRWSGWRLIGVGLAVSCITVACTSASNLNSSSVAQPSADTALTIWWDKGFTLEEDEALQQVVKNWEQRSGNTVKLSFYTTDELPQKAQRALQAGRPPDLLMSHNAERVLTPRLAWEGKLADVSDLIEPIHSQLFQTALDSSYYYNNVSKKRSYYAVPIHQATTQIFYRRDLLKRAGRREQEIPREWNAFWAFWTQIQETLQTQGQPVYALGLPISPKAGDTYEVFEHILEAYNVKLLDASGRLLVADPSVRRGIIQCLAWYSNFYQQGYVPPDAVKWTNPDNNNQLLNRLIVMTSNNSLSIPAAARSDPEVYYQGLGTTGYPNKPSGEPMRYLAVVRQAVIFNSSNHQQLARDFLTYLIQPDVTGTYLKAAGGRNLPVNQQVWQDPFWTDPADPHISTVAKVFLEKQTRLFYSVQNPAYSQVLAEKVWAKALNRIVEAKLSPEQAADEAIARIQQIFAEWQ